MNYVEMISMTYIAILIGLIGGVMASFITCMVDRMIAGEDWIRGRSQCDSCGHPLHMLDMVPIFSYIAHKGKCKYCGAKIPVQCLLTELYMVILFIALFMRFGLTITCAKYMILSCVLLAIGLYDYQTYIIPDRFHVIAIVTWLVFLLMEPDKLQVLKSGLLGSFVGIGLLVVTLVFDKLTQKEGLGGGDIKMFFWIGLYFGIGQSMLIVLVSCIIGLLFVVVLKKNKIPFGPSIAIACIIVMFIGNPVVHWYLGLFI